MVADMQSVKAHFVSVIYFHPFVCTVSAKSPVDVDDTLAHLLFGHVAELIQHNFLKY